MLASTLEVIGYRVKPLQRNSVDYALLSYMAFGITPKHVQEATYENLPAEDILIIGMETARKVGWDVGYISASGFIAYGRMSMSSWGQEVTVKVEPGKMVVKSRSTGSELFDLGKNKRNVQAFLTTFDEQRAALAPEEIAQMKSTLSFPEDDLLHQPPQTAHEKVKDFFSIFIPTRGFFVTPLLIDINLVVFLLMVATGVNFFLPDGESLLNWGANFRPAIAEREVWRLLTCCFIHIGVIHLVMNMYALLYIGMLLEPRIGVTRFLTAYLLTGIAASVVSVWWHPFTISAGASGAIFGMYGVFLAMLTTNLIERAERNVFLTSILVFVGYNLLNGLKGGVDNAAHIGGLLSGLLIGYAFHPSLTEIESKSLKYMTAGGLTVVVIVATLFTISKLPPGDFQTYEEKMTTFASYEQMALEVYSRSAETPREELVTELRNRGIYYWKECLRIVDEMNALDLPEPAQQQNWRLQQYCKLRIQSYELMSKALEEGKDLQLDLPELKTMNDQIESIVKEISKAAGK
ncbi:MAG TPA: rhomboid family intramembrane serine protease [Chryseolinea sp.]